MIRRTLTRLLLALDARLAAFDERLCVAASDPDGDDE